MAATPQSIPDIPIDFRAPPPSPVASGRRSSFANDDVLTEFLESSLRVPDLILPDKIFPKQKFLETPPKVDFRSLCSDHEDSASSSDIVSDSMARIGCFQLVNHGIPRELMTSSREVAQAIFQVSPEKRATVTRSPPEKPWGFEEYHSEEDASELSEEFVWCRDHDLKLKMEGISPIGYSKFSKEMEALISSIEKVAEKIVPVTLKNFPGELVTGGGGGSDHEGHEFGTLCCVYKHSEDSMADGWGSSLKYDVIRMLIRGTDYCHALCLHVCDGCSEFHVYSKKGWLSFCPEQGALIVTAGDQIQVRSGGLYKQVIGRPILKGEKAHDSISMAFLYSPANNNTATSQTRKEGTISLGQQALLAIILILVYQFLIFLYKTF